MGTIAYHERRRQGQDRELPIAARILLCPDDDARVGALAVEALVWKLNGAVFLALWEHLKGVARRP